MATTQNFSYPSSSDVTITGIGNPTGVPVPPDAVYVAAENPSGNLEGLQTDSSGNLKVTIAGDTVTPLPTSDAADGPVTPGTVATKSILTGGQYNTTLPTLTTGQQAATQLDSSGRQIISPLASTSTVTVVQPTGSNLHVQVDTSALPTGAATAANQLTGIANQTNASQKTQIVDGSGNVIASTSNALDVAVTQPLPAGANNIGSITNITGTVSLPTGAATAANQTSVIGSASPGTAATSSELIGGVFNTTLPTLTSGQQVARQVDSSGRLIIAPLTSSSSVAAQTLGTAIANAPFQNVYSTTPITTAAYVQLVASTTNTTNTIHIFDSSGQAMILGIGASGSEVATLYVPPGGDNYTLNIPAGSRIAYKALSATANSGFLLISFLE